jgi:KipI family sensor histidine kinase inhibitor
LRRAFYLACGPAAIDEAVNDAVLRVFAQLQAAALAGIYNIVPGYYNILVEYDDQITSERAIRRSIAKSPVHDNEAIVGKSIEIPVAYGAGEHDLAWIAEQTGLSIEQVIAAHSERVYRVFAVGFTPGFPYLGTLDARLQLPRRATPRTDVAAGSVAIAGAQSGIYPSPSPGGWHLLGQSLLAVYDPGRDNPCLLAAGDRVRFVSSLTVPSPSKPSIQSATRQLKLAGRPVLRVETPGLQTTLQDVGRRRVGHVGLAEAGALDARAARLANALVGNSRDLALLEMATTGPVLVVLAHCLVAVVGGGLQARLNGQLMPLNKSFSLNTGDLLDFLPTNTGVRAYLALAGGIAGEDRYDSRATDLRGQIGGLARALVAGDVLQQQNQHARASAGFSASLYQLPTEPATIRLLPGPQHDLLPKKQQKQPRSAVYQIESGNRMGIRLFGPAITLGQHNIISEGTPLGAMQVLPSGQPLVLLHDRGTLGGYPKPWLVHPADLWRLAQLGPGRRLRLVYRPTY